MDLFGCIILVLTPISAYHKQIIPATCIKPQGCFCAPAGIRLHLLPLAGDGKANKGIHQCAHWFMHTPPACADMIRIPAERQKRRPPMGVFFFGAPAGIRTPDTLLKRQVLCLLSYWGASARSGSVTGSWKKGNWLRLMRQSPIKRRPFQNQSPAERVWF